jgi:16S rRNA processing protein RimM
MTSPIHAQAEVPVDLVELGRIVSAYGVRGWIKIQPHSAQSEVLLSATQWWLKAPSSPLGAPGALARASLARVVASRPQGSSIVAQLEPILDRDQAMALKGYTVSVPRSSFPSVADDEYYWIDLEGCLLFGEHDGAPALIGTVIEVLDNGAHGVLRIARGVQGDKGEITPLQDARGRALEVLVPFVQAHVHTVDLANKRLDSNWPVEF